MSEIPDTHVETQIENDSILNESHLVLAQIDDESHLVHPSATLELQPDLMTHTVVETQIENESHLVLPTAPTLGLGLPPDLVLVCPHELPPDLVLPTASPASQELTAPTDPTPSPSSQELIATIPDWFRQYQGTIINVNVEDSQDEVVSVRFLFSRQSAVQFDC